MAAVLAAHRSLNVDPGYISSMTSDERRRVIQMARIAGGPLAGPMEFGHALRKNAYACEPLGEPAHDPINGRDLAAAVFKDTQPKGSSQRAKYCAWQLMNEKKNADKLYITADAARSQLGAWDSPESVALLVPHPKRAEAVTTKELAAKQVAINAMWRDAVVVARSPDQGCLEGLDALQRDGALKILRSPASLLNGAGGVGKSLTTSKILCAAKSTGCEVICLAPTHKAKYNIAEAVPQDVQVATIQSYALTLKRGEPVDELFVVIDESSMLDVDALGDFAMALVDRVARWQIVLVGDEEQLPPVGRGECFRLAVKHSKDDVVRLVKCYRAAFVPMFDFHCAVREGRLPDGDGKVASVKYFGSDREVMKAASDMVKSEGANVTYIAWRNADVDAINKMVQARETGEPRPGSQFNANDAVIYVGDNKPAEGLTNAMTGTVVASQRYSVTVKWNLGDLTSVVQTRDVRLAYCLTVHKAQGSGFARVCVVCTASSAMLGCLDRRWLYTAVSRAQKEVTVLCTPSAKTLAAKPPPAAPLSCLSFRAPSHGLKGGRS